jgi:hypothetical protein
MALGRDKLMSQLVMAGLCGFIAGIITTLVVIALLFMWKLKGSDSITLSRGPGPEFYKQVEITEYATRPQGLYIRFRNRGTKAIEMAHFKVRGYKDDKLWAEFEEGAYCETQPGQEQEAILQLQDYRDRSKKFDLSDCRLEVQFLYGYVLSKKAA